MSKSWKRFFSLIFILLSLVFIPACTLAPPFDRLLAAAIEATPGAAITLTPPADLYVHSRLDAHAFPNAHADRNPDPNRYAYTTHPYDYLNPPAHPDADSYRDQHPGPATPAHPTPRADAHAHPRLGVSTGRTLQLPHPSHHLIHYYRGSGRRRRLDPGLPGGGPGPQWAGDKIRSFRPADDGP